MTDPETTTSDNPPPSKRSAWGISPQTKFLLKTPNFAEHWQYMGPFFSLNIIKLFILWFAVTPFLVTLLQNAPDSLLVPHGCSWHVSQAPPGEQPRSTDQQMAPVEFSSNCSYWEIPLQLPFKWYLLWVASLFFALALITYRLRCPSFIKRYPNYQVYRDAGHSLRWIVWEFYYSYKGNERHDKMVANLITKGLAFKCDPPTISKPEISELSTFWIFEHDEGTYKIESPIKTVVDAERETFWEVFGGWAGSRKCSRKIIKYCLYAAFLLTVVSVAENVGSVVRILISRSEILG